MDLNHHGMVTNLGVTARCLGIEATIPMPLPWCQKEPRGAFLELPGRLELPPRAWQARALAIYALAAFVLIDPVVKYPGSLSRAGYIISPALSPFSRQLC